MDSAILLWIHERATPALDGFFLFSNELGTIRFCGPLVLAAVAWHAVRRQRREAAAWIILGVTTLLLPELIKLVAARPRPLLWPRLIEVSGFSFPSGHAVASATFYPLIAWLALRSRPRWRGVSLVVGFVPALYIGLGRLYLGVHWPSDVLAGWALGAVQCAGAILWITQRRPGPALAIPGPDETR